MKKLTPETVRDYHEYMARKFRCRIINKRDVPGAIIAATTLECMGVWGKKRDFFLDNFAQTIGDCIFIHWEPGEGSANDLAYQCRTIGHECRHVRKFKKDPHAMPMYVLDPESRARQEKQCMKVDLEIHNFIYGATMDVSVLTVHLERFYRIRKADAEEVREDLRAFNEGVARGLIRTRPGKAAIRFLKKRIK